RMRSSSPIERAARRRDLHYIRRMAPSKTRHELRRARDAVELALFTGAPAAGDEVKRALAPLAAEVGAAESARVGELARVAEGRGDRDAYRAHHGVCGVRRFATSSGAAIYQLAIETFPDHVNNVYLIRDGGRATLYDCGSQMPSTRDELRRAALILRQVFGE